MAQNVTIAGASYPDVPSIVVPKTGGGSAAFLDTSDADATAADVRSGKKFYGSSGSDTGSMPDGSATTPATTINAIPLITVSNGGLITTNVIKSQNVTPTVSAGYIVSGTAGTISVSGSNTKQLETQAGQTITPGTSDIVISAQKFLTGAQTIKGDANLVAANIAKDVTIFGVTGTLSGGGFSNTDALLHINAPTGSTVTLSKGGVTVKVLTSSDAFPNVDGVTSDYYYSVTSANYGTWTISISLNGDTVSDTVSVSETRQYDVIIDYKHYIFRSGVGQVLPFTSSVDGTNVTVTIGTEYINIVKTSDSYSRCLVRTTNKVDISDYSTLSIRFILTNRYSYGPEFGIATNAGSPGTKPSYVVSTGTITDTSSGVRTTTLNISSYSSTYYVSWWGSGSAKIYDIYMEK